MYKGLRIAVVIPAFNEQADVARTVRSVPGFVDHVLVVDDASHDATYRTVLRLRRRALEVLRHPRNRGVGASIVTGYQRALALGADVAAVMAGDGQMDPMDLPRLLDPIASGHADYAKGNRFLHSAIWRSMPPMRLIGNIALSLLTKITSGYWRLFDSQCGYTAAARVALQSIELAETFPRYGYPNDLLARLRAANMRVVDVRVRPVYGSGWRSGISILTVIYPISFVLLRSWVRRLWRTLRWRAPMRSEPVLPHEVS